MEVPPLLMMTYNKLRFDYLIVGKVKYFFEICKDFSKKFSNPKKAKRMPGRIQSGASNHVHRYNIRYTLESFRYNNLMEFFYE
jgi:hypothetical protein